MNLFRRFPILIWLVVTLLAAIGMRGPWLSHNLWSIDEGVTFTIAQQIADGDVLYRDAVDHRTPLVPYLKAAVLIVAGDWNLTAIHLFVALLLGASALLVGLIATRLQDRATGIAAAAVHLLVAFLYLGAGDNLAANTGWFLIFFSSLGFYAFARSLEHPTFRAGIWVGVWFGLSALCKQPGLLDFGVTWVLLAMLAVQQPDRRRLWGIQWLGSIAGAALPVIVSVAYFTLHGVFTDFVYYAFTYNTEIYVPAVPISERIAAMITPFELARDNIPGLGLMAALGGVGLLVSALVDSIARIFRRRDTPFPVLVWLILGWTATGIISTGLSGRTFAHYSAQVVPGLSLAAGWVFARLYQGLVERRGFILRTVYGLIVLAVVVSLLKPTRTTIDRLNGWGSGDPEIAAPVRAFTNPAERIFVWGYFPEDHVVAQRLPATRFAYSNFLTGLIPWTNTDAMIDTSESEVPGAWDAFYHDFAQHPPALIVDRMLNRAQIKYPLARREPLWTEISTHYAEVAFDTAPERVRYFRRLAANSSPYDFSALAVDPDLHLSGAFSLRENETAMLQLEASRGNLRFDLVIDGRVVASLDHPATTKASVRFFLPREIVSATSLCIVAHQTHSRTRSADFDLEQFRRDRALQRPQLPLLHLVSTALPPESASAYTTRYLPYQLLPDCAEFTVPARLVFPCPTAVDRLSFVHGIVPSVRLLSDGYDIVVRWIPNSGEPAFELWHLRVLAMAEGRYQMTQETSIVLPPRSPGRLEFAFDSGPQGNANNDQIFFGQLHADVSGPSINVGEAFASPTLESRPGPMDCESGYQWVAHAPTVISWPRLANLAELEFDFGIHDGAFDPAKSGHTDGVQFLLKLVAPDGSVTPLFDRLLDPFNVPADRGPQTARVAIPPHQAGRIVFETGPGPNHDGSWDWSWVGNLHGHAAGPPLKLDNGQTLVSQRTGGFEAGRGVWFAPDRWTAHAPSEIIYPKPAELAEITVTFGIGDGAGSGPDGGQRSDGLDVVILFAPTGAPAIELFRRTLNPHANPDDYGLKSTTLAIPLGATGELICRTEAGPSGDNSYDWAFWGPFSGRIVHREL